ncbi:MAG: hypothetical protein GXY07_06775 [Candidatus Hydrogenedentes bacterium]|nr:hypothetical protein [Candidatus Hydrogenedentota bacterium]
MKENEQKFNFSEDLIEILATYFRDAIHVEHFMYCIADRASGPLMKYLESTCEALREEEAYMSGSDEDWNISLEEAEDQIENIRNFVREKSAEISRAKKILQECAKIPPCFGAIWEINPDTATAKFEFPTVNTILLVETPESSDTVVQAIPISDWPELAAENDLVFQKSAFHPTIVVTPFLEQPIPLSKLKMCIGHLMDEELDALLDKLEHKNCVDHSKIMGGSALKNKIHAYFEPCRIFQEFMTIATTSLRVEALQVLATHDSNLLENVKSLNLVRTRLNEKKNSSQTGLRLAASSAGMAGTWSLSGDGSIEVSIDYNGSGRISVFLSPTESIAIYFQKTKEQEYFSIRKQDGTVCECLSVVGAADIIFQIIDPPSSGCSDDTVAIILEHNK